MKRGDRAKVPGSVLTVQDGIATVEEFAGTGAAGWGACAICAQQLTPRPCRIWWCTGWTHLANREVGSSHFCYLGNSKLIATPTMSENGKQR